jgi:hypothetical protein
VCTLCVLLRGCNPRLVHVIFMVYKVALEQDFLRELQFSHSNIIPLMLSIHLHPHDESPTLCRICELCIHCTNYTII